MLREIVTTLLELIALALIVVGVALIYIPAAFIAAGAGLGVYAWRLTPKTETETPQ